MTSEVMIRLSPSPAPKQNSPAQERQTAQVTNLPTQAAPNQVQSVAQAMVQPTDPLSESSKDQEVDLNEAVARLNDIAQMVRRELKFSVDEDSGRSIITVIDSETDETIRQIPSEEILSLIHHLQETGSGLVKEKA